MNILSRISLAGVIAMLGLAASPLQATIHNISVGNFFFTPGKTQACLGDTIRWTWAGGVHQVDSDPSSPKTFQSPLFSLIGSTYDLILTGSDPVGAYPVRLFRPSAFNDRHDLRFELQSDDLHVPVR